MTLPTLSLIVPVFDAERDLGAFLQSLAQQTVPPTETIFIDDGSTDGSQRMLAAYAAGRAAVRIVRKTNGGAGAARNTGLGVATGSFIAFADADDLLAPDIYERLLASAERDQLDVVVCNAWNFFGDRRPNSLVMEDVPLPEIVNGEEWLRQRLNSGRFPHYSPLHLCRREMIEQARIRFPEGITHEDVLWVTEILLAARRLGYEPRPLYTYRRRNYSMADKPLRGQIAIAESSIRNTIALAELADRADIETETARLLRMDFVNGGCSATHVIQRIPDRQIRRDLGKRMRSRRFFRVLWDHADTVKLKSRIVRAWLRSQTWRV